MALVRDAIPILATLATVFLLNLVVFRALRSLHPRRAGLIRAACALGNLFWIFLPFVLSSRPTPLSRAVRATLGPPWFLWLMFLILETGFLLLLTIVWWAGRTFHRKKFSEFGRLPSTLFLITLALVSAIGVFQALVPLHEESVEIPVAGLPSDFDRFRLVLISDLHVGLFSRSSRLQQISRTIEEKNPDLVLIAGDFIDDDPWFIRKFINGLDPISSRRTIVAVLGNHEMYGNPLETIRRLAPSRVRLLVNDGLEIRRLDSSLWIAGLSDFATRGRNASPGLKPDLGRALSNRPANATTLLVAHQPKAFELARAAGIPLTLAGHTHGGQCGFRSVRWTLAGLFLPYDLGLYQRGDSFLYVTPGASYWLVPIRIGMTPEITTIDLRSRDRRK